MAKLAKSIAVLMAVACAGPAAAQLRVPGGLGGALPNLPSVGGVLPDVGGAVGKVTTTLDPRGLAELRVQRLDQLVRRFPRELDVDEAGDPVVRGQVLATSPSPEALAAAVKAGFTVGQRERLDELGVELVSLTAPARMTTREAVRRLKRLDPRGSYDFNPLYFESGEAISAPSIASLGAIRVGLIDTGFETAHPSLAGVTVERQAFVADGYRAAAHGLSVASLTGAGKGSRLYSADVYGGGPTGGSALAVVRALAWMVQVKAPVVNVSLVGPANAAVQQAVTAVQGKGALIVAAVGNDGPAAPPAYPASYPGVIAVTGVDRRGKVLLEAGRASHLDFAAPGADISAAQGQGYAAVRGTSFAAPIVSGRLAALMEGGSKEPVTALSRQARQPGKQYGRGLIGAEMLAGR